MIDFASKTINSKSQHKTILYASIGLDLLETVREFDATLSAILEEVPQINVKTNITMLSVPSHHWYVKICKIMFVDNTCIHFDDKTFLV